MMYRSGWATKPGQERILAVELRRSGFESALAQTCLSHFDRDRYPDRVTWARLVKDSPVRVQWDPERSLRLAALEYRSVQVGLSGAAVERYVDEWIVEIDDVTGPARAIRERLVAGDVSGAATLLPVERSYPLPRDVAAVIGADQAGSDDPAAWSVGFDDVRHA